MAKPIKQAQRTARKACNCYLCGHPIRVGDNYLSVTFKGVPQDRWAGLKFVKVCRICQPHELCACGDCDFVVTAEPAEPIRSAAGAPF